MQAPGGGKRKLRAGSTTQRRAPAAGKRRLACLGPAAAYPAGSMSHVPDVKRRLNTTGLTMINIVAIASLRDLPQMAEYGWLLVAFYVLAAVFFFIPVSFVAAELATAWPLRGGVYVWVKEAFGQGWGFMAVFLQWFQNACWFPVVLTFGAASLAYAVAPTPAEANLLANDARFVIPVVLGVYWGATLLNFRGLTFSAIISGIGTWAGVILPGLLLLGMGALWLAYDKPSHLPATTAQALPGITHFSSLSLAASVLLAFAGMEMTAAHAREVTRPDRAYPIAIAIAVVVILLVFIGGALVIANGTAPGSFDLQSGVPSVMASMGRELGFETGIVRIASGCIFLGVVGSVNSWIPGPSKGLLASARDGTLPHYLTRVNYRGAPVRILVLQGIGVTAACVAFTLQPSVQAAYYLLSVLANQLYLIMYVLMFAAALWLRRTAPYHPRPYRIPGGTAGLVLCTGCGLLGCVGAWIIGFIPPAQLSGVGMDDTLFVRILLVGVPLVCAVPWLITLAMNRHVRRLGT